MPELKRFSEVVSAIEDASLRPDVWVDAIGAVAGACGAEHAVLFTPVLPRDAEGLWMSPSVSDHHMEEFVGGYLANDLWQSDDAANGTLLKGVRGTGCVRRHDKYPAGFLRPGGMGRMLSAMILKEGNGIVGSSVHLSLTRRMQSPVFRTGDETLLRHLVPHLRMAFRIGHELARERRMSAIGSGSLQGLRTPAIVVDRSMRLIFANDAGRDLLKKGDGFVLVHGHVTCVSASDAVALGNFVATLTASSGAPRGLTHHVRRMSSRRPYLCIGTAVPVGTSATGVAEAPLATLFVRDPNVRSVVEIEVLQIIYGFSPAEAAVAQALLKGQTLEDAANERGISYGTARTQLKSLFGKTGCRRQSDLIALLLATQPI